MPKLVSINEEQFEQEAAEAMETALANIEQEREPFRPRQDENQIAKAKEYLKGYSAACDAKEREIETKIAAARTIRDQRNQEARAQCEMTVAKNDSDATAAINQLEEKLFQNRTVREGAQLFSTHLNKAELPK